MTGTLTRDQRHPSYQRMLREALEVHEAAGTLDSPLALRLKSLMVTNITLSDAPEESGEVFPRSSVRQGGQQATGTGSNKPGAATDKALSFARDLMAKKQSEMLPSLLRQTGERIAEGGSADWKTCRDLIDALKALPWRQRTSPVRDNPPAAPGTYTEHLGRVLANNAMKDGVRRPAEVETEAPAPAPERVVDGYFMFEGAYVKVQLNRAGTASYAKKWDGEEWVYVPGLVNKIRPEMKLTSEQASAFGALYGRCIAKGCKLTHETSIRLGYGEKCAANNGWYWG